MEGLLLLRQTVAPHSPLQKSTLNNNYFITENIPLLHNRPIAAESKHNLEVLNTKRPG